MSTIEAINERLSEAFVFITNCAGKTVARTFDDADSVTITFTDGTYAYMQARERFGSVELDEEPLDANWGDYIAHTVGLITDEEMAAIEAEDTIERAARDAAQERALYEQLKAKYEGKS